MGLDAELRHEAQQGWLEAQDKRQSRAEVNHLRDEIARLNELLEAERRPTFGGRVPDWTVDYRGKAGKRGIVTLQASDWHFDEEIDPAQVSGYNAYSREIAIKRLAKLAEGTIKVARDYITGIEIEGIVVLATGDVFSGDIHDELRLTNADTLFGSVDFWTGHVIRFLDVLASDFGQVHVGAVVGNHGRMTHKPIYKNRARNNVEWLLWRNVARHYAANPNVTVDVSEALDLTVQVYKTRYWIEHGEEFRGGSGISGSRAPLLLGQHRLSVQQEIMGNPLDWMVVGHFHQYQPPAQGLVMGGSLKGYDEYAKGKKFRPEPPQQALWITSPEHGPTIAAPVFVQDRKAEGW